MALLVVHLSEEEEDYQVIFPSKGLCVTWLVVRPPESRQANGAKAEKGAVRRSNRTRQNNKRADTKLESNDSLEIPHFWGRRK